ncbi:MAG: hypothetical protein AB9922_04840 [Bacteroidales bacterium]
MKTKFLFLGIVSLVLFSCDGIFGDRQIWDISPVVYIVQVVNTNGVDLLNPDNPGSIAASGIKAIYNGKEYECNKEQSALTTKAYMPHFFGLKVTKNQYIVNGTFFLTFGELDGAKSYSGEEITILWGDGTSDKVRFNRKFRWKINGDPDISEEWFLNGNKVAGRAIRIVK